MADHFDDESWLAYKKLILSKLETLESLIRRSADDIDGKLSCLAEQNLIMQEKIENRVRKLEDGHLTLKAHASILAGIVGGVITIVGIIFQFYFH